MCQHLIDFCRRHYQAILKGLQRFRGLSCLAFRFYLAPIFWMAGTQKLMHIQSTAQWFGNPDWGLGLPYPLFLAYFVAISETLGSVLLLIGWGVRLISIPLMCIMLVAAFAVHLENGWLAIASNSSHATERLAGFMQWLQSNFPKRHDFITELGSPVILNNGVEFAVTYFVMLLSLFFTGAGSYVSLDYWLGRYVKRRWGA